MLALFLSFFATLSAQEHPEMTLEADVVSQYVWRGMHLGGVSLQPTVGIGYQGLSFSAWGTTGLADSLDPMELDLTLSYTTGGLTLALTDYWSTTKGDDAKYFCYQAHRTKHVFEATAGYDFGLLSLTWNLNFAGDDYQTSNGHRSYSSFVELTAPFRLADCDWEASAGFVPYASDLYGTTGFGVTHLSLRATHDIPITSQFTLPIFGEIAANPYDSKAWLVFGLTLRP